MNYVTNYKKILLIFFCILFCLQRTNAQYQLKYDLNKDKKWIDSVKWVIKSSQISNSKPNDDDGKMILKNTNACSRLAVYYRQLFKLGKLKSNKLAIQYFQKASENYSNSSSKTYEEINAIQNNISRVLADIFFKGEGVKKDFEKSYQYALWGMGFNKHLARYYSTKYLGTTNFILNKDDKYNFSTDTIYTIYINPFLAKANGLVLNAFEKQLIEKIAEAYKKQNKNKDLNIVITGYTYSTPSFQAMFYQRLDNMKNVLVEKYKIGSNNVNIQTGVEVNSYLGYDYISDITGYQIVFTKQ
jgi:hypothetical protein